MIQLIALDLDGTLLKSDKSISKNTKEILIECQKQGIQLILASGRPTPGLFHIAKELSMDQFSGYLLSYNGAALHEYPSMNVLHAQSLSIEQAKRIVDHGRKFPQMAMRTFNNTSLLCEDASAYRVQSEAKDEHIDVIEVSDLKDAITFEPYKFLLALEPDAMIQIENDFKQPLQDEFHAVISDPYYMEVMSKGVSKGKTLHKLLNVLQLSSEHLMAFGDGQNDLEMLKVAKTSICMENGHPHCKEVATFVTTSNDEDGIVHAIEHFQLLKGEGQ